ncbi:hypothetical protein EDD16DRAFT_1539355 [Pisolithus croceorrhizus]|nr:hypothetical protein EDD16DRAFT_1539355 [Pisolithus croceorrhizus]
MSPDGSSDVEVCTRRTTRHEATVESMKVHIWEVSGFNKPEDLKKNAPDIEDKFGPVSEARSSVNVILFCMRGQKVTATTKRIFELIHGVSKKRIPIVLVINHLERERDMEDWWRRNQGTLGTRKVAKVAGGARRSIKERAPFSRTYRRTTGICS